MDPRLRQNSFALISPDTSAIFEYYRPSPGGFLSESDMAGPDEVRNYPD